MNSIIFKQVASFFTGAMLTGLCYGFLLFLFVMATFSFAGETLSEKESREAFAFFSLVTIMLATLYVSFRQYRSGRKFTAAGVATAGMIALYGTVYTGNIYVNNLSYYEAFDKTVWIESRFKPFKMAKTLVKKNKLRGLSKQEVIDRLGTPENSCGDSCFYLKYTTDENYELRITFDYKVKEAYLWEEGLFD